MDNLETVSKFYSIASISIVWTIRFMPINWRWCSTQHWQIFLSSLKVSLAPDYSRDVLSIFDSISGRNYTRASRYSAAQYFGVIRSGWYDFCVIWVWMEAFGAEAMGIQSLAVWTVLYIYGTSVSSLVTITIIIQKFRMCTLYLDEINHSLLDSPRSV